MNTARAQWAADYREARKVRHFELSVLPEFGVSSLGHAAIHDAYIAAIKSRGCDFLCFSRRNGRFGVYGLTKRFINGPRRRLPA